MDKIYLSTESHLTILHRFLVALQTHSPSLTSVLTHTARNINEILRECSNHYKNLRGLKPVTMSGLTRAAIHLFNFLETI